MPRRERGIAEKEIEAEGHADDETETGDYGEPRPDPYWLRVFGSFPPEEAATVPDIGCCGILSPLVTNTCIHELDLWLEEQIESYSRPSKLDLVCHNPSWPEFVPSGGRNQDQTRKMDFVRYGMQVLIGIRGPWEDAVKIRRELIEFCEVKYGSSW